MSLLRYRIPHGPQTIIQIPVAREQRHRGPERIDAALDVEETEDGPGEDLLLPLESASDRLVTAFEANQALMEPPPIRERRKLGHLCMRAWQDLQPQGDIAYEGKGLGVIGESFEDGKIFCRDRERIFREFSEYSLKQAPCGAIHQDLDKPVLVGEGVPGIPLNAGKGLPLHPADLRYQVADIPAPSAYPSEFPCPPGRSSVGRQVPRPVLPHEPIPYRREEVLDRAGGWTVFVCHLLSMVRQSDACTFP